MNKRIGFDTLDLLDFGLDTGAQEIHAHRTKNEVVSLVSNFGRLGRGGTPLLGRDSHIAESVFTRTTLRSWLVPVKCQHDKLLGSTCAHVPGEGAGLAGHMLNGTI